MGDKPAPKRIPVTCNDCGKPIEVAESTYNACRRDNRPFRCTQCRYKYFAERTKVYNDSRTPEQIQKQKEAASKANKEKWERMDPEKRESMMSSMTAKAKEWKKNETEEERERISKIHTESNKRRWENYTDEEREQISIDAKTRWENRSDEYKREWSEASKKRWSIIPDDDRDLEITNIGRAPLITKARLTKKKISGAGGHNELHQQFEAAFNNTLHKYFYYVSEYPTVSNKRIHCWDYAIFDQNGELECLVDLDGTYYHADNCDYNGLQSHEEYDERRHLSIPDGVKWYIVYEKMFDKSFKYLLDILPLSYDEFVDKRFREYRMMPFPYPIYSNLELIKSFDSLIRMDCNDKYHQDVSLNTRNGDRLAMHFHYSIFHAHVGSNKSPHDIWKNDKQLRGMLYNHELLHNYINKNKILQGFNLKYRVPFMSAGRAKMIIEHCRDLRDCNEIFDPFSEFSGRMLATISLGKKYIGQDISEIHVRESQNVIEWLYENMYEFDVHISCTDSSKTTGVYQCLFTSLPRRGESYEDVDETTLTCDEWIDICLKNYKCETYVFLVDETCKYNDCVADQIDDDLLLIMEGSI